MGIRTSPWSGSSWLEPAPGLLIAPLPGDGRQASKGVSPLRPLTGHTDWVQAVAWSPDSTRLRTGSADNTARVWDATSGLPLGFTIVTLPGGELVVFDAVADQLVRVSAG